MTDGLIIDGPLEDQLGVFDCPNCKQTIATSADVCRFCGARVNHEEAEKASRLLGIVDQACSDASVLRYTAGTAFLIPVGTVIGLLRSARFVERVGFQNVLVGFCALVLILSSPFPIWSLRWWKKYANLKSDDEEFQNGRDVVRKAGFAATVSFLAFGLLLCAVILSKAAY